MVSFYAHSPNGFGWSRLDDQCPEHIWGNGIGVRLSYGSINTYDVSFTVLAQGPPLFPPENYNFHLDQFTAIPGAIHNPCRDFISPAGVPYSKQPVHRFEARSLSPRDSGMPSPVIFRITRSFSTSNAVTPSTFQIVFFIPACYESRTGFGQTDVDVSLQSCLSLQKKPLPAKKMIIPNSPHGLWNL